MDDRAGDGPATILVGVDGSETSMRAGAYAAGLARRQGAKLLVVYVHTIGAAGALAPGAVGAIQEANADVARDIRDTIYEHASRLDLDVLFVERNGNPYTEIVREATERRVDAVIIGASMSAGHRLIGSLAVHLVRDAKWPVTVVP